MKDPMRQAWEDEQARHDAKIRELLPQYTDADELARAAWKACEPDKASEYGMIPRNYLLYALYCVHNRTHILNGGK